MGLAVVRSRALAGMAAPEVAVEVHLANGLPAFTIVGLPEAEVKEARERVRSALQTCGFEFPARRVTVNLAPADLPKESGRFDLPIAIGLLVASDQLRTRVLDAHEFAGELALTGALRSVRGALAMTFGAHGAGRAFVLPAASASEAALVADATVHGAANLLEVCAHLSGTAPLAPVVPAPVDAVGGIPDMADVKGQAGVKRALEAAAAGGHSVLMIGPPGTGKSMLAERFPGILPPMTDAEALASAAVQSLGVGGFDVRRWRQRPYRAPHHTASPAAIVGGGAHPRPGEISLAMHGVLFLDELPEMPRSALETLREPLESGRITISRAAHQCTFPAEFQLVAAMNPCPCGHLGDVGGRCRCTPDQVARYRGRLSGPLLDRIDVQIDVMPLPDHALAAAADGEPSAAIRARVARARAVQIARQGGPNARLAAPDVDRWCAPDAAGAALLRTAAARLGWSARGHHRVLKLARSVADLAGAEQIGAAHVAEAIQYRRALSTV
ncbi:MAG: YifB family Mg chelatase-like AAA ATPase [Burkholderiales bacterium]|jgi:magnesium chelatase family protein|nr:YifB family Mg chelatase-like AAA ATPase [Burkholderiales bacterium]